MSDDRRVRIVWWGAAAGLATWVVYSVMAFVPLPTLATVLLASAMGPLFGLASWGLREFLTLHRRSIPADLAAIANALAGALLTAMLLVQLAVDVRGGEAPSREAVGIWLGLDVAWDVYGGVGTLLFGVAALRHPRLGTLVGVTGILLASALLALNLYTFPMPPGNAGLVDLGPAVALWYVVVTVIVFNSMSWVRAAVARAERA